jgi:hypothetical protein
MGKILALVLGLAVVTFVAWKVVYGQHLTSVDGVENQTPPEALKGAKQAAKRIENNQEKRLDETLEKGANAD